jgi:hypothetical protein
MTTVSHAQLFLSTLLAMIVIDVEELLKTRQGKDLQVGAVVSTPTVSTLTSYR